MFKRKTRKADRTPRLLVPRTALLQALARATYDGNREAIASAKRLLDLCDERGNDSLVF